MAEIDQTAAETGDGVAARVLLVDDHDLFRTGLRNLLEPLTWSPLGPGSASCTRLVTRLSITNHQSRGTNHQSPTVQISGQIHRIPARSSKGLRLGFEIFAHVTHVTTSDPCSERAPLTDGELW